jgi:hypothetical protein
MIRLRQQRLVQRLYDLGPAPLVHFLDELAAEAGCIIAIDHLLKRYGAVEPVFVRALGGDKLPPGVHLVEVAV